ncbi:MAG: GNAT family N-acetyltransferase [Lysobacterales bacterium]
MCDTPELLYSPLESERYGIEVYRCELTGPIDFRLRREIADAKFALLILRVPAGEAANVQKLLEDVYAVYHADTLVHYVRRLGVHNGPTRTEASKIRLLDASASGELHALALQIFSSYRSHHSACSSLSHTAITEGYADWSVRLLTNRCARVLGAFENGRMIGFIGWTQKEKSTSAAIELNGVAPANRNRGVYNLLLSSCLSSLDRDSINAVSISTQVWNVSVQRVWQKQGFLLSRAQDTLHVGSRDQ